MGSAWACDAEPKGLGRDVYSISDEPYGASCAFDRPLSANYLQAAENFGLTPDLCAPNNFRRLAQPYRQKVADK